MQIISKENEKKLPPPQIKMILLSPITTTVALQKDDEIRMLLYLTSEFFAIHILSNILAVSNSVDRNVDDQSSRDDYSS